MKQEALQVAGDYAEKAKARLEIKKFPDGLWSVVLDGERIATFEQQASAELFLEMVAAA